MPFSKTFPFLGQLAFSFFGRKCESKMTALPALPFFFPNCGYYFIINEYIENPSIFVKTVILMLLILESKMEFKNFFLLNKNDTQTENKFLGSLKCSR